MSDVQVVQGDQGRDVVCGIWTLSIVEVEGEMEIMIEIVMVVMVVMVVMMIMMYDGQVTRRVAVTDTYM